LHVYELSVIYWRNKGRKEGRKGGSCWGIGGEMGSFIK